MKWHQLTGILYNNKLCYSSEQSCSPSSENFVGTKGCPNVTPSTSTAEQDSRCWKVRQCARISRNLYCTMPLSIEWEHLIKALHVSFIYLVALT